MSVGSGWNVLGPSSRVAFKSSSGGLCFFFFFKQKTAYEMCGRDWSSDVCSSDLK